MEMKKKENKGKERQRGSLVPTSTSVPPARIMRTTWNQLISPNKRVVTEILHFFEIGEALAKFALGALKVKSYLNYCNEINFSV